MSEFDVQCTEHNEVIASAMFLTRAAARVSRERTLQGVYRALTAAGDGLPGLILGWMAVLDPGETRVKLVASWGAELEPLQALHITADESETGRGPSGTALRTGRVAILDSVDEPHFAPWQNLATRYGLRSGAAFPLKAVDGGLVGVLTLYSDREGFFTPVRQALFTVFAEMASVAIENARLAERLDARSEDLEATVRRRTVEVARRNEELAQANARLADSAQFRTEFLSHMSHELRSPLTAILGFAEVLKDELYGPLNPRQKEHLGHIWQAGRQLLDVIDDVVELSRVESGRTVLDLQDCYPRQILEAAASQMGSVATSARVSFAWSVQPSAERTIHADARKIKQALFNLGALAARSAGSGGRMSMVADTRPDAITFEVTWDRAGTQTLPSDPAARRSPGFGVSLAHRLVELHGGVVLREDRPDGGCFRIVLPFSRDAAPA